MNEKISMHAARLSGGALVVLLGACAGHYGPASDDAASYGLSVAAQAHLPRSQQDVAACLHRRENTPSYPQGVSPGYTSTEVDNGVVRLTQWFYLKRGATWTTYFVLRSDGERATDVQVLLPVELTASQGYRRAAMELISRCKADFERVG